MGGRFWTSLIFLAIFGWLARGNIYAQCVSVEGFQTSFPAVYPSFVATVVVEVAGKPVGLASGFLVDGRRGLVATNAHVALYKSQSPKRTIRVFLAGKIYEASAPRELMNLRADIALLRLRLRDENITVLPSPAKLNMVRGDNSKKTYTVYGGAFIKTKCRGLLRPVYGSRINGEVGYLARDVSLEMQNFSYDKAPDISLGLALDIAILKLKILNGYKPTVDESRLLYENLLLFKPLVSDPGLDGYSGGPVVGPDGAVFAVMSEIYLPQKSGQVYVVAVPAGIVNRLLRGGERK